MTTGQQVGFVGLGNMGGRMTRRLVEAGVRVVGYDTRAGQAASVGAVAAESLGDVCAGTEVVLLSLPDSKAVESVVLGTRPEADGLLSFAQPGQVIIDLSTSAPSSTQRLHAALAERGVEYLRALHQAAEQLPERGDARRDRRGDGRGAEGGARPGGGA
jgi:3-hydroxyisobutyrate dehydrogenase